MAYVPANLVKLPSAIGGSGPQLWHYKSADAHTDVDAANYFSDGSVKGMRVDDIVFVVDTATPTATMHRVSAVTAGGAATIGSATLA